MLSSCANSKGFNAEDEDIVLAWIFSLVPADPRPMVTMSMVRLHFMGKVRNSIKIVWIANFRCRFVCHTFWFRQLSTDLSTNFFNRFSWIIFFHWFFSPIFPPIFFTVFTNLFTHLFTIFFILATLNQLFPKPSMWKREGVNNWIFHKYQYLLAPILIVCSDILGGKSWSVHKSWAGKQINPIWFSHKSFSLLPAKSCSPNSKFSLQPLLEIVLVERPPDLEKERKLGETWKGKLERGEMEKRETN